MPHYLRILSHHNSPIPPTPLTPSPPSPPLSLNPITLHPHHPSPYHLKRFDYVNVHAHFMGGYTAVDNWPVVAAASELGMGVFIISPNHQAGRWYRPTPVMRQLAGPLEPMEFHLLWLLTRPGVKVLSSGPEMAEEMGTFHRCATLAQRGGPAAVRLVDAIADRFR